MELTRKEALTFAQNMGGLTREQARFAYQNMKNALRNTTNLRGFKLRQQARYNLMGLNKPMSIAPVLKRVEFNDTAPLGITPYAELPLEEIELPEIEEVKLPNISFGEAFKAARKRGDKTFTFNGKLYNTNYKEEEVIIPKTYSGEVWDPQKLLWSPSNK